MVVGAVQPTPEQYQAILKMARKHEKEHGGWREQRRAIWKIKIERAKKIREERLKRQAEKEKRRAEVEVHYKAGV